MTLGVLIIVLSAALLHAVWNALVKGAEDKAVVLGFIALGHVIPGLFMVAAAPTLPLEAVPFVIASTVVHWGYYYLLNTAYKIGDFSIVYPISRGLAPVLIALGSQLWIGESLAMPVWVGILMVSGGIMVLTGGLLQAALPPKVILTALGVAFIVSAYSLVDGVGIRVSQNALGYIGWLFVAEIFVAAYIFLTRFDRLRRASEKTQLLGLAGGIVSGLAYAMVLYAKTFAPLGVISALRETSVVFAALIGIIWFREGPRGRRFLASVIVALGISVIAING